MQLPRINGKIDTDEVANIIVMHILAKVAEIYGSRIDNATKSEFEQYTKDVIESIIKG